jgi:hypothetical protein
MIDSYSFGRMTIGSKIYSSDIILLADRIISSWWRKEGHNLCLDDLEEIPFDDYDIFIVGTGFFGAMNVDIEVRTLMAEKGIEFFVGKTEDAVRRYNEMSAQIQTAGAFHLTC